ncbi:hypothetical protein HKD37_03G008866 [Glycine soja]
MALSLPHESSVSHYCTQSLRTWEIPSPLPLHPNPKPPIFFFRHFNMLIPIQIASFPVIGRRFATVTGFRIAEDEGRENGRKKKRRKTEKKKILPFYGSL